jgi:hypothetical protein
MQIHAYTDDDDLKKMNDDDSDEIDPQLIGSLMYLVNTRPDLCYAVNVLSQFMSQSRQTHWIAQQTCIEIYTRHSWIWPEICLQCGLEFAGICRYRLAESTVDRKSTSGCCFTLKGFPWFPGAAGNKALWP